MCALRKTLRGLFLIAFFIKICYNLHQKGSGIIKILIINGPNINMLGIREKHLYGNQTYNDLLAFCKEIAKKHNIAIEQYQSNVEGFIVDKIQEAYEKFDGIIINPAAYTHTSVAILDTLKAVSIPTIEVHLTNINEREEFRKISFIRQICIASFIGYGFDGYKMAIEKLIETQKR